MNTCLCWYYKVWIKCEIDCNIVSNSFLLNTNCFSNWLSNVQCNIIICIHLVFIKWIISCMVKWWFFAKNHGYNFIRVIRIATRSTRIADQTFKIDTASISNATKNFFPPRWVSVAMSIEIVSACNMQWLTCLWISWLLRKFNGLKNQRNGFVLVSHCQLLP